MLRACVPAYLQRLKQARRLRHFIHPPHPRFRLRTLSTNMDTRPVPLRSVYPSDDESSYCIGSYNSGAETDSDVPGPGRLLGKAYVCLGKKVETGFSNAAMKFGLGPRATAVKIRRLVRECPPLRPASRKKLKKAGKQLVKYAR